MGESDPLATLIQTSTTARAKIPGIVLGIGVVCIVGGLSLLVPTHQQLHYSPSTLPPFPTGLRLQSIVNSSTNSSVSGTISVNTASLEELDSLPGIGVARAQKIVDHRPYRSFQDLVVKSGISENILGPSEQLLRF